MLARIFQEGRDKWKKQNLDPSLGFQDALEIVTSPRWEEDDELYKLRPASPVKAQERSVLYSSTESPRFS